MKRKQKKVKGKALANQKYMEEQQSNRLLYKILDEVEEHLAETEGQHRSECAMYGDSWPGAQIQIANIYKNLWLLETRLKLRSEPPRVVTQTPVHVVDTDDIPF